MWASSLDVTLSELESSVEDWECEEYESIMEELRCLGLRVQALKQEVVNRVHASMSHYAEAV